jgi:hypothetical protein
LNKRLRLLLSAVLAFTLALAGIALAHTAPFDDGVIDSAKDVHGHKHAQHGESTGHLAARNDDVQLISKLKLKNVVPEKIADVGVHKGFAYLAAWGVVTCKYNGVHVVDIKNPAKPREVAFIGSKTGSYPGEGVQAIKMDTAAFDGDILVTNNEKCNQTSGFGGMNIYDITNPKAPTPLYEGFGDDAVNGTGKKDAHETHSVFAWDAGARAYAVMVDNEEAKDVDIVDITNPKKPKLIAEYDLAEKFPQIKQAGMDEIFLHDMIVKKIGNKWVMLASYWDAGYVKLDVTDPKDAKYLADSDYAAIDPEAAESGFTVPPEGNGHQGEFTKDNRYAIGTDEDFAPFALTATTDDGSELTASQGSDTRKLAPGQTITGQSVFFGRGCNGDATAPPGDGSQIAVVERGLCTFTEKVANVERVGGYAAVFIFNRTGSDGCDGSLGMSVAGGIPTFGVAPRGQGFGIFDQPYSNADCLAGTGSSVSPPVAVGTRGDRLTFSSYFDGWGYVHLFDARTMQSLDTYAIPEAHDPSKADGFGDLSVHEVAVSNVDPSLAYYAYYSGGFRATRIIDGKLVEVASFIDSGGSNFWGVEVFKSGGQEYVAASDRDLGLYIFQTKGAAAPNATP